MSGEADPQAAAPSPDAPPPEAAAVAETGAAFEKATIADSSPPAGGADAAAEAPPPPQQDPAAGGSPEATAAPAAELAAAPAEATADPASSDADTSPPVLQNGAATASDAAESSDAVAELPGSGAAPAPAASEEPQAVTITAASTDPASADPAPANGASPQEPGKPAPYAFTGMQCVLDKCKAPVCALSFGRLDSALLAFGADDGSVRIASCSEQKASTLHEMREHKKRVTDLDWSLSNDQLLTSSEDGSVCLSSQDDGIWSMARRFETPTAAMACLFHPVNQNLIIVGTGAGTIEVFNTSTGLPLDNCRAQLTSSQPEGVGVACMDVSRDVLYVADTTGYIHAMRMALDRQGALSPVTLLLRVPPAGNRLASLASLSFTAWAASVKGPALLAAGTDDLVCVYKVLGEKGGRVKLELASKHLMPQSARPIRAAWCPTLPSAEPEYIASGSEDTAVYVYDITDAGQAPLPVVRLQGHCAPVVAVAWAFDERRLASSDCDGTVIVWKREHAVTETNDDPY